MLSKPVVRGVGSTKSLYDHRRVKLSSQITPGRRAVTTELRTERDLWVGEGGGGVGLLAITAERRLPASVCCVNGISSAVQGFSAP